MPGDQASIGDLKWFEICEDKELQKMVRTAMMQNYDLRLAIARINAARANLGLARSDQFPQLRLVQISRPAVCHLTDLQGLSAQTENQLSFILGNNPGSITRSRPLDQQQTLPVVPAGLPSSLLERRSDIRAAEERRISLPNTR